jgi:hypothetical protein
MTRRLFSLGLVAALLSVFTLLPADLASAQKKGGGAGSPETTFPVSFVGTTAAGAVNFVGTMSLQKFDVQNNQVVAIGSRQCLRVRNPAPGTRAHRPEPAGASGARRQDRDRHHGAAGAGQPSRQPVVCHRGAA